MVKKMAHFDKSTLFNNFDPEEEEVLLGFPTPNSEVNQIHVDDPLLVFFVD
jgi:hypothetical protein